MVTTASVATGVVALVIVVSSSNSSSGNNNRCSSSSSSRDIRGRGSSGSYIFVKNTCREVLY